MLCHVLCSKCARTCPWVACCQACCRHRLRGAARHQLLCEVVRQWQAVQHAQLAPRLLGLGLQSRQEAWQRGRPCLRSWRDPQGPALSATGPRTCSV